MLATVVVTVVSNNLAYGVIVAAMPEMVLFARRVAHLVTVERVSESSDSAEDASVAYGEPFFASNKDLVYRFHYSDDPQNADIGLSHPHIWDAFTVAALDAITTTAQGQRVEIEIIGLNENSADRHDRLSGHLGAAH